MEIPQTLKGLPIKEHDSSMEKLEKENFDLKLQINHLRLQLREFTNQSSLSILPCDCKKKHAETQSILAEAKSAMEALMLEKEHAEAHRKEAFAAVERLQEEKNKLESDCIKLSAHISRQHEKEKDGQKALEELKKEILAIRADTEEADALKRQLQHTSQTYALLKEEYVKLEEFSKRLETDYKAEMNRTNIVLGENASLKEFVHETQKKTEGLQQHITALEQQY